MTQDSDRRSDDGWSFGLSEEQKENEMDIADNEKGHEQQRKSENQEMTKQKGETKMNDSDIVGVSTGEAGSVCGCRTYIWARGKVGGV